MSAARRQRFQAALYQALMERLGRFDHGGRQPLTAWSGISKRPKAIVTW